MEYDETMEFIAHLPITPRESPVAQPPEFKPWGKTPRFFDIHCVITEKLDGTNALVHIDEEGRLFAGSRNRWLDSSKKGDNFGFHAWCMENQEELLKLGAGWHYGEWWGQGIGRGYGLSRDKVIVNGELRDIPGAGPRRIFSLFNTHRWGQHNPTTPACCSVVPKLYDGKFSTDAVNATVDRLKLGGSHAAPGFMDIEGVVVYLPGLDQRMKVVVDKKGPSPIERV